VSAFRCYLLGHFRVEDSTGRTLEVKNRKSRALLALLLQRREQRASRDELISLLWSRSQPEQGYASLRKTLSDLRKTLSLGMSDAIASIDGDLLLQKMTFSKDLDNLTQYTAVELTFPANTTLLDDLDGLDPEFDEWLYYQRIETRRDLVEHFTTQLKLSIEGRAIIAARRTADWILKNIDQYNEVAISFLIRDRVGQGKIAAAIEFFSDYERRLKNDLNLPCPPEIMALVDNIRGQHSATDTYVADSNCRIDDPRGSTVDNIVDELNATRILHGRSVFVLGSIGMGKTHLLNLFDRTAPKDRVTLRYDRTTLRGSDAAEILRNISVQLAVALCSKFGPKPRNASAIQFVASHIDAMTHLFHFDREELSNLTFGVPSRTERELEPKARHLFEKLCFALSDESKVCIILDDFDTLSEKSQDELLLLGDAVKDAAVFWLVSASRQPQNYLTTFDMTINLAPLHFDDVRQLVIQRGPTHKPSLRYLEHIYRASGGVPLLLTQLLDADAISGRETMGWRGPEGSIETFHYPGYDATVRNLFSECSLEASDVALKVALLGCCVLGSRYTELFGPVSADIFEELGRGNIISSGRHRDQDTIELLHARIGDVIISSAQTETLLALVSSFSAETLSRAEKVSIFEQFLCRLERPILSNWMKRYIVEALRVRKYELIESFANRAMTVEQSFPDWCREILVESYFQQGKFISLKSAALRVVGMTPEISDRYQFAGAILGAESLIRDDEEVRSDANKYLSMSQFFSGAYDKVAKKGEALENVYAFLQTDDEMLVHDLGYCGMANAQLGNFDLARRQVSGAIAVAKKCGNRAEDYAEYYRQFVLVHQGEVVNALACLIPAARYRGDGRTLFEVGLLRCLLGFVYQVIGSPGISVKVLSELRAELPIGETGILAAYLDCALTSGHTMIGNIKLARQFAEQSLSAVEVGRFLSVKVWVLRNHGILADFHGVSPFAGTLERALELAVDLGMRPDIAHLNRIKGASARRQGQTRAAEIFESRAEELYRDLGMHHWLKRTNWNATRA
jgi:DNA-binding SARP family transcriptional activator/tetratricopeptide (TPR) repeat protein